MTYENALKIANNWEISVEVENIGFWVKVQEALEKQIAKKPERLTVYAEPKVGWCPICNQILTSREEYCDKCGQKLDWNKEKKIVGNN